MDQTHNTKGFTPADEAAAPISYLPVATGQTIARGDAVIDNGSGQLVIALAASAEIAGVSAQIASGLAAGTLIAVWADPRTNFVGRANGANAITPFAVCDIIGATGEMELDENATAVSVARVVSHFDPSEVDTSVGRRITFRWNKHAGADTSS